MSHESDEGINTGRRRFLIGSTTVVGAAGTVGVAVPFVASWNPSAKAKAAGAPIKIDINKLAPGAMLGPIPAWRGQPVFIVRRSQAVLDNLANLNDRLADPESARESQQPTYAQNTHRSIRPEILVLVGLCTHLGCSPKYQPKVEPQGYDADWQGGFYCPCHGSTFDLAGRVYKSKPAPSNLPVPPHSYESENVIVIGIDEENA